MTVMVLAEQLDGEVRPITYELLGKARELADALRVEVSCLLIGYGVEKYAEELIYWGADEVILADDPELRDVEPVRYSRVLVEAAKKYRPRAILVGATNIGRSIAARAAAALSTGLTADCLDVQVDEQGDVVQVRPAFTGNIIAYIKTRTRPAMATVRYRVAKPLPRDISRKGRVTRLSLELKGDAGVKVLGKVRDKEVRLSDADIIVGCGRGFKKPEDLKMAKELAEFLGGVVGVSRPLVDEGWMPRDYQVGFSGNTVRPKLYIALGISGSPQHLAGMKFSDTIIAVNLDPSAPIFRHADYGVVGDIYRVVPKLIEKLRERLNRDEGGNS